MIKNIIYVFAIFFFATSCNDKPEDSSINRKKLVKRHNIIFTEIDSTEIPQVGNGEIAFGIDVTGLQTLYGNTLSQWGWHSFPLPEGKTVADFKMTRINVHNHTAEYPVDNIGQKELFSWLRENPHRLNLGKLSFLLDGKLIAKQDLSEINQKLDLWQGVIYSNYKIQGIPVKVITICHPKSDAIAVKVESKLIREKRLTVQISFPYGHAKKISGGDWNAPDKHETQLLRNKSSVMFNRFLDKDSYNSKLTWENNVELKETAKHTYELLPMENSNVFSFNCHFSQIPIDTSNPSFEVTMDDTKKYWEQFWSTGGAIDLSESKDSRWKELERRVVLSQYLLAVNEAGSLPPQESGLLLNSGWYGKFHLEMHWWHGAHYQLWNRWPLFERSLDWYKTSIPVAQKIAKRQGYEGTRWPKMIGPDGRFGPSFTGPWLIWQQPHPIFYAEQNYRIDSSDQTLQKWKDVVFETADFMASYAYKNKETGKYDLGPWLINAAENNHNTKESTINPAFELAYWRYGLGIACKWRERMELPTNEKWLDVLKNLAPLPVKDDLYVMYENVPNMWTDFNKSHIDVIGAGAFLPIEGIDKEILNNTIDKVNTDWKMNTTWGWDFPWLAMASARAGQPKKAINALLMDSPKNRYSKCGINTGGPAAAYFPGNGGLLYAIAMMSAGWDGENNKRAPGFPDDGSWTIKHEGLMKAQ
ncbi:glycoside hydrolase family 65 protein [Algibacter lectus]|uniref:hypothetical protein n=1 Tax=Algibacter lectus TaxID=221126 RepID=UPI0009F40DA9|nr:hypothetical protein [Algibacter lectus]